MLRRIVPYGTESHGAAQMLRSATVTGVAKRGDPPLWRRVSVSGAISRVPVLPDLDHLLGSDIESVSLLDAVDFLEFGHVRKDAVDPERPG